MGKYLGAQLLDHMVGLCFLVKIYGIVSQCDNTISYSYQQ